VWERLANLAQQGAITTPVSTVYGFADVPQMIAEQVAPRAGKSVLRVASP
jgi:NADPH2:quinone reductase